MAEVMILGFAIGVLIGFCIAWMVFEPKIVSRNLRIKQLE